MKLFVFLLLAVSIHMIVCLELCQYVPFGENEGDSRTVLNSLTTQQGPFTLPVPIIFYLQREQNFYLSPTGDLMFADISEIEAFSVPVIAPAWSSFASDSSDSTLYHRISQDQTTLNRVKEILTDQSTALNSFQPSVTIILTWENTEEGTMQMILSTDGSASFATFLFDRSQDIGGQASNRTAEFSVGDETRLQIPSSYSNSSLQCVRNSFRIDGYCISTILPEDMCDLTSYTVDCMTHTSTACRCRQTPDNEVSEFCIAGSLPNITMLNGVEVVLGCYPTLLPCYISEDCPSSASELNCLADQRFVLFGGGAGDRFAPFADNANSSAIALRVPVVFYGKPQTLAFAATNGIVSFQEGWDLPDVCQLPCNPLPFLAPLWADFDFSTSGFVFYRQTQDPATLDQVVRMITDVNPGLSGYQPTLALIVTWFEAQAHDDTQLAGNPEETFQVVVSTDGELSFATFIYDDPASTTEKLNMEGERTVSIGFDSGDWTRGVDIGNIRTRDMSRILGLTNSFRIDGSCITNITQSDVCDLTTRATECAGLGATLCTCREGFERQGEQCVLIEASTAAVPIGAIAGGVAGGTLLLLLACIVVAFVCWRQKVKKRHNQMEITHKPRIADPRPSIDRAQDNPYFKNFKSRSVVDTSFNLKVPKSLLVNSCNLQLGKSVGQGEFGIVYKAILKKSGYTETVAVKTLKGFLLDNLVEDLLEECTKMKEFDHPNVLKLQGVCLDGGPAPYIVMPFMTNGSLHSYLKENRTSLIVDPSSTEMDDIIEVQKRLLDMCIQVAKGMEYLASKRVVHRDLAARNCMIDQGFVIKVADFGLSVSIDGTKEYFRQNQDEVIKLPIKWMALESINDAKFSEKSDVWAYGVTCWEVFTGARIPYAGVHPLELGPQLYSGHRLEKPPNAACTDELYSIVSSCWKEKCEDRPCFSDIVKEMVTFLSATADYLTFAPTLDEKDEEHEESPYHVASS